MQTNTLSPSLFALLLEQAAEGKVRPANLISNVQNGQPVTWQHHSAAFTKDAPGRFTVTFYRDAQAVGTEFASTPVEAKLMVLDYVISQVKQAQPA